jgi:hypothetical protein
MQRKPHHEFGSGLPMSILAQSSAFTGEEKKTNPLDTSITVRTRAFNAQRGGIQINPFVYSRHPSIYTFSHCI